MAPTDSGKRERFDRRLAPDERRLRRMNHPRLRITVLRPQTLTHESILAGARAGQKATAAHWFAQD